MPFLAKNLVLFTFLHKKRLVKFDLMFAEKEDAESEPYRIRTCDTLIKRYKRYVPEREKK
jgi:hypothetical protein